MLRKILQFVAVVLLVAGLSFLLFPPVSNSIGKQIAKDQAQTFTEKLEHVITEDDDGGTGVTEKTFAKAYEKGEVDKEGYPVDAEGKRTSSTPVVFKMDLDRLHRDSIAYNEALKHAQGSRFSENIDNNELAALNLADYGIFDGIYGYVEAPDIDMTLPLYLGTSDWNMSYGAAHMTNTSLPIGGTSTNAVAAGHTGYVGRIFFDNIRYLDIGDRVYVRNFWETLTYEIAETRIVAPNQSEGVFIREGEDLFTMFTCIPAGDGTFGRYLVTCKRV